MTKYKVSAIVSTYKSEKFISGCLRDLVNQTLYEQDQLEIIVIDSNSPENEGEIVKEFQAKYPHIVYHRTFDRETLYAAWNRGIKMAQGEYITNANTDDRFAQNALKLMSEELDCAQEVEAVYGNWLVTQTENDTFESDNFKFLFEYPEFIPCLFFYYQITSHAPLIRKSVFAKIGDYHTDFKVFGDREFMFRFCVNGLKAKHIAQVVGLYLDSADSLEKSTNTEREFAFLREKYTEKDNFIKICQYNFELNGNKIDNQKLSNLYAYVGSLANNFYSWNKQPVSDLYFASQLFSKALELDKNNEIASNNIAVILCLQQKFEQAISLWTNILVNKNHKIIEYLQIKKNILKAQNKLKNIDEYSWFKPEISHERFMLLDNHPLVSIIVPCYNHGIYLPESIESIINQTYSSWEIIIVNDGSKDNTEEIANQLIETYLDKPIKLINQKNQGVAIARETGIKESSGRFILFLDADDLIHPQFLEETVAILLEQAEVGFVYVDVQYFGVKTELVKYDDFNPRQFLYANQATVSSLFRKELYDLIGGFKQEMDFAWEDWEFWISIIEEGWQGFHLAKPYLYYRQHETGSRQNRLNSNPLFPRVQKAKIIALHPDLYSPSEVREAHQILRDNYKISKKNKPISTRKINSLKSNILRPFWSVVIPTYNPNIEDLKQTIDSILEQDIPSAVMEILVVDDCSDNENDINNLIQQIGPRRISYHRNKENLGLISNWNHCLDLSKGYWIHILHQDDYVLPNFYQKLQLGFLEAETSVGASFCRHIHNYGDKQKEYISHLERETAGILENWIETIAVQQRIQCASIVVKRSFYE